MVAQRTGPEREKRGERGGEKGGRKGARKHARKTLVLVPLCCDIVGLLQESKRPLPRKLRKKSEKGFPGPLGLGVKKPEKKLKTSQRPGKNLKIVMFDSFSRIFDPGAKRPREPLSDIFQSFLERGLYDSCRRPTMS